MKKRGTELPEMGLSFLIVGAFTCAAFLSMALIGGGDFNKYVVEEEINVAQETAEYIQGDLEMNFELGKADYCIEEDKIITKKGTYNVLNENKKITLIKKDGEITFQGKKC